MLFRSGGDQGAVLLQKAVLRLRQDLLEVLPGQGLELDTDGKAPLELGDQVGRFYAAEGAGRDEEDKSKLVSGEMPGEATSRKE